jgi:hypothetical protein
MEQNPWEANSSSGSEEIICILWNPNAHYHGHKSPQLAPILSHKISNYTQKLFQNMKISSEILWA